MKQQKTIVNRFHAALFAWHKSNYREMAWRNTHDPYRILVSEIMLQQTQVARVREKYAEFIKNFPTVKKLAEAPLGDVLRLWSGLGYNRRAKFLHQCAKVLVHEFSGKFPSEYEKLVQLPGVGRSTAGALLAFSFGKDMPMIDTNIRRILVRVFYRNKTIPTDKELYDFAASIIPKGKGREWNYAMLDLGATLCTARNHSSGCPLEKLHGKVGDFVYKKPQKKFSGSPRYFRGNIVKLLSQKNNVTQADIAKILVDFPGDKGAVVEGLLHDGLIKKLRGKFMLP